MPDRFRVLNRPNKVLALLLGVIVVCLFVEQSRSLYCTPQADIGGDETWLMRDFQEQMKDGIAREPDAPLSTISHNNGILLNSMWLSAAIYGIPAFALFPHWSLVSVGRTISLLLALVLIVYGYAFLRRRGLPAWMAVACCLLLVANRSFLLASHSSRYDLFVALGALLALDILSGVYTQLRLRQSIRRSAWILLLCFPAVCLAWNIHLTRIELLPYIFTVILLARRSFSRACTVVAANVITLVLLLVPSVILMGQWNLFTANARSSQLSQTLSNVPILHKFSLSVVRSTFVERFAGIEQLAPLALIVSCLIIAIGTIVFWFRKSARSPEVRSLLPFLLLTLLSWAITLRFVSYYGLHILPVLVVGGGVIFYWLYRQITHTWWRRSLSAGYVLIAVLAAFLSFRDSAIALGRGEAIVHSIQSATTQALSTIRSERLVARPTVLVGLQLQDFLQREPDIRAINWLYQEYPDTPITLPQFLEQEHVCFIMARKVEPIWAELKADKYPIARLASYAGTFGDWGYDYFERIPASADTLLLARVCMPDTLPRSVRPP